MPRGEVEEHRKKYSEKNQMSFEDYGIKTVAKRATKRAALPNAAALDAAVEMGEAEPAEFTAGPAEKGASAFDVQAKLEKPEPAPASTTVVTESGQSSAPAGAPPAQPEIF